ncbi:MAG: hypothetical protein AAB527_03390 [Patescibacteria group bacterium]
MLEEIEKLQKKPQAAKEKILAASVIAIMALIVAVWLQTVRHSFSNYQSENNAANPLGALWSAAQDGFKDVFSDFNF